MHNWAIRFQQILGESSHFTLEERLFHAMSLLNGCFNVLGAASHLALPDGVYLFILQLFCGVILLGLYCLSRFRIVRRGLFWPFVLCLAIFLTINIIGDAGSFGGTYPYLITSGVIIVAIARTRIDTWLALGLFMLINFGLIYWEHTHADIFVFYDWPESIWRALTQDKMRYLDVASNSLFAFLLTAIISLILAHAFQQEREHSDKLLLNILPSNIASELRQHGQVEPREYQSATILFSDFVDFTTHASHTTAHELVAELDQCFKEFDRIVQLYGIEKIKTIGDSYMAVAGLPRENETHALDATRAAQEMLKALDLINVERKRVGKSPWRIRIGLHTGRLVAGVIGSHKFAYDVWGDAVNIASRMESSAIPGTINLSKFTYERIKDHIKCEPRGLIPIKNHGEIEAYIVR